MEIAGWDRSTCKIVLKDDDGTPSSHDVDGWKRGDLCVWEMCERYDGLDLILSGLTHLPTGYTISLFTTVFAATSAGDIAGRVCDWTALEVEPDGTVLDVAKWKPITDRLFTAWKAAGLAPLFRHDRSGGIVWGQVYTGEEQTKARH